ncbi:MAG: FAD-dependent oxidoreductase [Actinomycetota bacterium]
MSHVLVLGAGPCGLMTAMLLARDGHRVTLLERDSAPPPDDAASAAGAWERKGVAQFEQAHFMHARFRQLLDAELPNVRDVLKESGATTWNQLGSLPPFIEDQQPRPDDDRFWTITARRPVLEAAIAHAAFREPSVTIRRGTKVASLLTGAEVVSGAPHVTGVRTQGGEDIEAELVVDAMGRRTPMPDLLKATGGRPPEAEAFDCGFTYYTRYFRSRDGKYPDMIGPPLAPLGTISCLTLPADNQTWFIVLFTNSRDAPLKALRHADKWEAVVRAVPFQAHWLEGEPVSGVLPMSGIVDGLRRYVVDGAPVVTGMVPVADAWACTNPSLGRGVTMGLTHAVQLRDAVRKDLDDPKRLAESFDAVTTTELEPWFRAQVQMDRARFAEMDALREGREPPPPPDTEDGRLMRAFLTAAPYDGDLFRAFMEYVSSQSLPSEILSRPGMAERALEVAEGKEAFAPPAPDRSELLALLS